jgi:F-type H+-transporting ATPase subunit alpha
VVDFEAGLLASFRDSHKKLIDRINKSGDYNEKIEAGLKKAIEEFKETGTF